jgi:hypothetical protein
VGGCGDVGRFRDGRGMQRFLSVKGCAMIAKVYKECRGVKVCEGVYKECRGIQRMQGCRGVQRGYKNLTEIDSKVMLQ